jgi:hypothetical protein
MSSSGGLMTVEDSYDSHPCMLPLVQLLERAAELTGDVAGGSGEVRRSSLIALA